jgi:uracil-DNA glycosylase family 4
LEAAEYISLPVLRGTAHGADCGNCPLSFQGEPHRPVFSESPEKPKWILLGEGPGFNETRLGHPFIGASGEVAMKLLARLGLSREQIYIGNVALCSANGLDETKRQAAASCCKTRLQLELAQYPGVPILTLGAVAARSVIPQQALDAIDPPDVPASKQKRQKVRQKDQTKDLRKRERKLERVMNALLKELIAYQRKVFREEFGRTASKKYIDDKLAEVQPALIRKARADAPRELELLELAELNKPPKAKKPKKKKPIKISDIVGTCFDVDVDGTGIRSVIPGIHPAALLRGGGKSIAGSHTPDLAYVNLMYDFGKVNALAEGNEGIRLKLNIDVEGVDPERATSLFVEQLHTALDEGELALDLETYVDDPERHHALMAYVAKIRAIGLSTKERSVSVLWDLVLPWAKSYFQLVLASPRVICTYHNALYDRTVLKANGYELRDEMHDTLLAHHSAFPGNAHGLQVVTSQFFATQPWKSEYKNADEDVTKLLQYNAKDTGATLALRPTLELLIRKNKNEKTYDIDRKMSECATRMHLTGMPVDREVNSQLLTQFSKSVSESRESVEGIARDPKLREQIWHHLAFEQAKIRRKGDIEDFETRYKVRHTEIEDESRKGSWRWKISAGKHVAALIQALGVELHQVTASGAVSTKKDVLESLVHIPAIRDLLVFRENDKLLSTFVWQIFDRYSDGQIIQHGYADANDHIHPIWNIHKISGRWASYEPVVSNVPKNKWKKQPDGTMKEVRPNLRRQIVAPKGKKFVIFDFAQLEARNLALISGDPFLLDVFASGKDIHTECSRVVFNGAGGSTPFDQLDPVEGVKTAGGVIVVQPCEQIVNKKTGKICGRIDFHDLKCPRSKMKKQLRDLVKQVEYGAFYGGSPETLWKVMLKEGFNVKLSDITDAINKLMQKMPGIVRWQRTAVAKASLPPYTITDFVLGRRRVFPMGQVDPNEALNYESQATAAAIMDTGMYNMDQCIKSRGYKQCDAIVQVHDAAAYMCWEDDAQDVADDVVREYSQSYEREGRVIPYPVDVAITDTWAGM